MCYRTKSFDEQGFGVLEKHLRAHGYRIGDAFNMTGRFSFDLIRTPHDEPEGKADGTKNCGTYDVQLTDGQYVCDNGQRKFKNADLLTAVGRAIHDRLN